MEKLVLEIGKRLKDVAGVATVMPTIFERVNHSHVLVKLEPIDERSQSQEEIAMAAREAMAAYQAYRPTVLFRSAIGGGENQNWPVLVNLYGPDLVRLSAYAVQLNERLHTLPQLIDIKARVNLGNPEIRVAVDRQRASYIVVLLADLE
jgi:HAE1 family hydrophobic/amphiphilic exporter-1